MKFRKVVQTKENENPVKEVKGKEVLQERIKDLLKEFKINQNCLKVSPSLQNLSICLNEPKTQQNPKPQNVQKVESHLVTKGEFSNTLRSITAHLNKKKHEVELAPRDRQVKALLKTSQQAKEPEVFSESFKTQQIQSNLLQKVESPVLVVSNLPIELCDPKVLSELFGVVGTVYKCLVMANHYKAFVEFEDKTCANNAREFFGGLRFFDNILDLVFSKYQTIDFRRSQSNNSSKKYNKIYHNKSQEENYYQHEQKQILKSLRIECELSQPHQEHTFMEFLDLFMKNKAERTLKYHQQRDGKKMLVVRLFHEQKESAIENFIILKNIKNAQHQFQIHFESD